MDFENLDLLLSPSYDAGYAKFHGRLVPDTRYPVNGVRVPVMRKLAQEMAKVHDLDALLERQRKAFRKTTPSYEAVMVHLLAIAYRKSAPNLMMERAKPSLFLLDNWGHCDTFASTLSKGLIKTPEGCGYIPSLAVSAQPYESRLGLVMALSLPKPQRSGFLTFLHNRCDEIPYRETPVSMAIAWLLSQYLATDPVGTEYLFAHWPFDEITLKRTKQKIRESRLYKT